MNVGSNIKDVREFKGVTQEELANQLHVTRQAVSNWENGKTSPSIETIEEIAKLLNTSVYKLIEVDKPRKRYSLSKVFIYGVLVVSLIINLIFAFRFSTYSISNIKEYKGTCEYVNDSITTDGSDFVLTRNVDVVYDFGQYCVPVELRIYGGSIEDELAKNEVEVTLPEGFDFSLKEFSGIRTISEILGSTKPGEKASYLVDYVFAEYVIDINYFRNGELHSYTVEESQEEQYKTLRLYF